MHLDWWHNRIECDERTNNFHSFRIKKSWNDVTMILPSFFMMSRSTKSFFHITRTAELKKNWKKCRTITIDWKFISMIWCSFPSIEYFHCQFLTIPSSSSLSTDSTSKIKLKFRMWISHISWISCMIREWTNKLLSLFRMEWVLYDNQDFKEFHVWVSHSRNFLPFPYD